MSMIFQDYAPLYWAAHLPVIPLAPSEKRPIPTGWSTYCKEMPTPAMQESWLKAYPDSNIGLPLGPCADLVAIDIDTDDREVIAHIEAVLPPAVWVRRGAKGKVLLYRWNGQQACKIKDTDGKMLVEILSTGNQVVLPPSIHPDTKRPYQANANLWEIKDQLPLLPADFEQLLRAQLKIKGVSLSMRGKANLVEWVAQGDRDNAIVRNAGLLARQVLAGKINLQNAFEDITTFVRDRVENVWGDPMSPDKAREKIVEFMRRDVLTKGRLLPIGWDEGLDPELVASLGFGDTNRSWSIDDVQEYLGGIFSQPVTTRDKLKKVDEVLTRMAADPTMEVLEKNAILRWIQQTSGLGQTVAQLHSRLKQLSEGDIAGTDHSQIADKVLEEMASEVEDGEIRFDAGRFWEWSGSCFSVIEPSVIRKRIADDYGHLAAAKRANDHAGIFKVMADKATKPVLGLEVENGINFANGFLTEDLRLHPHDRTFGATYTLPFAYRPELGSLDHAPIFKEFLATCWSQDEDYADKVKALQEAICYTLFAKTTEFKRAIVLLGVAKAGKSQVLEIVQALMPEKTVSFIPPTSWNDKFAPAEMAGKLLNVCGEISETANIDGAVFKRVISGEIIPAQFKGMQLFEYRPKAAHWFASNHVPRSRDTSAGFTRRWLILTFDHPVPKEKLKVNIAEDIIAAEREAIVAWAVQAITWLPEQKDFTLPKSHQERIIEIAEFNSSVRFFLTKGERVAVRPSGSGGRISQRELYEEYASFCRRKHTVRPVSLSVFSMSMRELAAEMGFRESLEPHPDGTPRVWYDGITPVEVGMAA